jgi:hypothetical protein
MKFMMSASHGYIGTLNDVAIKDRQTLGYRRLLSKYECEEDEIEKKLSYMSDCIEFVLKYII